jgi:hypothetical protein
LKKIILGDLDRRKITFTKVSLDSLQSLLVVTVWDSDLRQTLFEFLKVHASACVSSLLL